MEVPGTAIIVTSEHESNKAFLWKVEFWGICAVVTVFQWPRY
jgi:hypothetical protein